MNYKTKGTCSREISFDVVDNKVTNVRFLGGCSGNTYSHFQPPLA